MDNIRLAVVLVVLASVFPVHAAVPAPESAPDPIEVCEPPATVELLLWESVHLYRVAPREPPPSAELLGPAPPGQ